MSAKNDRRRERVLDSFDRSLDRLDEQFTGLIRIEVPVLKGIMGTHTITVAERDIE